VTRRVLLLAADSPAMAKAVEEALRDAGIPFESGVRSEPEPALVFTVRPADADLARAVVGQAFGAGPLAEEEEPRAEPQAPDRAAFPRGPLAAAFGLSLCHFAVVVALVGRDPAPARFEALGGLLAGAPFAESWRLLTSMFVHADPSHVFWNAVSMLVFAVPLMDRYGWGRTAAVYLASGVAGGIAFLAASEPGTVAIGSSGAVAGLFGCWLAATIRRARRAPLVRRATVRAVGIGLLVLPSLVTPTTIGGKRISVAAHLGGFALGLLCGAWMRDRGAGPWTVSADGTGPAGAPFRDPTYRS
jgi:rhomboid protease GluP